MSIEIKNLRPVNKGVVKYSFTARIVKWGMDINDCALMEGPKGSWITFPQRKYEDDGKTKYHPYVYFDKEISERLTAAIKEALKEAVAAQHPSVNDPQYGDVPF